MKKLSGIFAIIIGASLYGGLNSIVKLAYEAGYSFSQVTYNQYLYGAILLIPIIIVTGTFRRLSLRGLSQLALVGIIGLGGTSIFLYSSLNQTSTSIALVLLFQFTWISLLIEKVFLKKQIHLIQLLAIGIILIGTLSVLQIFSIHSDHLTIMGIVYGLLAAVCYSIFLIGASILPDDIPDIYKTAVMGIATLIILSLVFMTTIPVHILNPFNGIWRWGLLLGILGQIMTPLLFNYGAPIVGGTLTAVLGSVELPVGVILSSLLVGEPITHLQWLGVLLILVGIILGSLMKVDHD